MQQGGAGHVCHRLLSNYCAHQLSFHLKGGWSLKQSLSTGADADVLSIGEAIEPLFAVTPPPAEEQQCSGCTPSVKVVTVTWNGVGTPLETDTTSAYTLELAGDCALKSTISAA